MIKEFWNKLGTTRILEGVVVALVHSIVCYMLYDKGYFSAAVTVSLILLGLMIYCCLAYLDYFDEKIYWNDSSPNGYIYHKAYALSRKKKKLVLQAEPSCRLALYGVLMFNFVGLLFYFWTNFYFWFYLSCVFFFLMYNDIARYRVGKRNLTFDKELNNYYQNGRAMDVYDLAECSDVTSLQKIKDFSIVNRDSWYDLEMDLDDSGKLKLLSNSDLEYIKKIENELRDFLGLTK